MRLCSLAVLLALPLAAADQNITIDLDPAQSKIAFTLSDVLHTVHGTFRMKTGRIEFDPASKTVSGKVVVDAASGDSGSGARDKRMERDILQTDRYPESTFTPTMIEGGKLDTAVSQATVTGWLEIHGERHQISVPVQIQISGPIVRAAGHFVVPYVEWGMKNPSTFLLRVNDKVDVDVTAVGTIQNGK